LGMLGMLGGSSPSRDPTKVSARIGAIFALRRAVMVMSPIIGCFWNAQHAHQADNALEIKWLHCWAVVGQGEACLPNKIQLGIVRE